MLSHPQVERATQGQNPLRSIHPLSEEVAVINGAELLSEVMIYSVAGATVTYEWRNNKRDAAEKERKATEAEARRRADMKLNEQRQWEEFTHLNQRITLLQEEVSRARHAHATPPLR